MCAYECKCIQKALDIVDTMQQIDDMQQIELPAILLDHFLWSNKNNINQKELLCLQQNQE